MRENQPTNLTGVTRRPNPQQAAGHDHRATAVTLKTPNAVDLVLTPRGALVPKTAAWNLQFTYAGGDVITPLAGAVTSAPNVTNSTPTA